MKKTLVKFEETGMVITGHQILSAIKSKKIHVDFLSMEALIQKSMEDRLEVFIGHIAKLRDILCVYEQEVLIRVDGEQISLRRARYIARESGLVLKRFQYRLGRLTEPHEVITVAEGFKRLRHLRGLVAEGRGTRVTVNDPEVIQNAGVLGLM